MDWVAIFAMEVSWKQPVEFRLQPFAWLLTTCLGGMNAATIPRRISDCNVLVPSSGCPFDADQ